MSPWCIKSIFPILNRILSFTESPLWLLLQVAPIRNERDLVVLLLLTFRDITAFKQLIDAEETKSGNFLLSISRYDAMAYVHSMILLVLLYFLHHRFIKICKTRTIGNTFQAVQCAHSKSKGSIKTIEFGTSKPLLIFFFVLT